MTERYKGINWTGAGFLVITPILALIATPLYLMYVGFYWPTWVLAAVMYTLTAMSITGGYHRYFAHRTYEARTWLKLFYAFFGAAAFQNSILIWARDHRVHHRFVDTDADPYSINRGFFWAHFGWMMINEEPLVKLEPYGRDLERDPIVAFQDKHYVWIASFACFVFPMIIGALIGDWIGGLFIAGLLRVVALHHMTFFINSWCHVFGRQTYTDTNSAKDSFVMAVATFGEGYHNFHHYFANDYRNGIRWYHWDPTKWAIRMFSFMGGAHSLRKTPQREIEKAQMIMQEKRLKNRLNHKWDQQFQQQLDTLKANVEAAHLRWEQLREEYKKTASDYAQVKMDQVQDIKRQIRQAKAEYRHAFEQWRRYKMSLLETVPVRA